MHYTILDDGRKVTLSAEAFRASGAGQLYLSENALEESLGWQLKPEGLCRTEGGADVCVPVRDRGALVREDGVDLAVFADLLGRPVVIDTEARVVALGRATSLQAASMASLEAPDFELPDLAGQLHTLSAHRGKKALLIVYASW